MTARRRDVVDITSAVRRRARKKALIEACEEQRRLAVQVGAMVLARYDAILRRLRRKQRNIGKPVITIDRDGREGA